MEKSNKEISVSQTKQTSFFRKISDSISEFFFPISSERKKKRINQIKNIGIFMVSTLIFVFFEDKINKLISIDLVEIEKIRASGPSRPL